MNKAMIPIKPSERLTAVLQVSINPSALWIRKAAVAAPAGAAVGAFGEAMGTVGEAMGAGAVVLIRMVSPERPVTISLNMSLSFWIKAHLMPATNIETIINAAHILLNAMVKNKQNNHYTLLPTLFSTFAAQKNSTIVWVYKQGS
jgi:hypothetical protein